MGTGAIIKAAQTKALVSGVADLFAKRARQRQIKQASAAAAGKLTKQALVGELGKLFSSLAAKAKGVPGAVRGRTGKVWQGVQRSYPMQKLKQLKYEIQSAREAALWRDRKLRELREAAEEASKQSAAINAGMLTKQALLSTVGQLLLRFGGKGLRWGGKGLQRLGLAGAGQQLRRTGAKMRGTASKATLLERAQKGQQAAAGQTGRAGRKAQRAATQRVKALGPEAEKSLNISKGVGAGGLGLGAYGLASMLSGAGDEE